MDEATNTPSAKATAAPRAARMNFGMIALLVALFGILAVASWYAAQAWISVDGPPMPATGYVAMTLGVVFSLLVGCGLMALLFYSSRHGYDERAGAEQAADPDDGERG
jgi:hypothetical protein